jgi:hypothetical protein
MKRWTSRSGTLIRETSPTRQSCWVLRGPICVGHECPRARASKLDARTTQSERFFLAVLRGFSSSDPPATQPIPPATKRYCAVISAVAIGVPDCPHVVAAEIGDRAAVGPKEGSGGVAAGAIIERRGVDMTVRMAERLMRIGRDPARREEVAALEKAIIGRCRSKAPGPHPMVFAFCSPRPYAHPPAPCRLTSRPLVPVVAVAPGIRAQYWCIATLHHRTILGETPEHPRSGKRLNSLFRQVFRGSRHSGTSRALSTARPQPARVLDEAAVTGK